MNRSDTTHSRRDFLQQAAAAGLGAYALGTTRAAADDKLLPVTIISTAGIQSATVKNLMLKQQFLEKFGVKPEFIDVVDGNKIISGLLSGTADICIFSGFSQVLPAIEKGGGMKILAGSLQTSPHQVYARDPAIKTLSDLKGKTVGVGPLGALLHQIMVSLLNKKGIDVTSVNFVNAGSAADVFRAVAAGKVDAGPADFDYDQPNSGTHVLPDGIVAKELPDFTFQASYTGDVTIKDKRDILVRTLAAYAQLYRFMESPAGKDAYIAAFTEAMGKEDMKEANEQWDWIQSHEAYATNLVLSPERVDATQKMNLALGVQKRSLTYEEATDMSIAKDAIALLTKTAK
jgi:ABC-type nitrate/sulfonate/bicarbonate transport system substrate-binding protein